MNINNNSARWRFQGEISHLRRFPSFDPSERVARWYAQIQWKMSISLSIKTIRRDQHLANPPNPDSIVSLRDFYANLRAFWQETAVVCGANVKTINLCASICTRHVSGASHFCSCKVVKISRVWEAKQIQKGDLRWFSIIAEKSWKRKLSFIDLYTIMILRNSDLIFGCLIMVILWAAR